ncbi:MAG TPA: HAD-IC family P-type ATPase [Acholeplasmataceae bacterium]|nr:HAD-IC family P-type ATPase [Acholeplasmataceae bacterium]
MIEEKNIKTNTEIVAEEEKTEVVEQYVFERINSDFKTGLTEDVVLKRQEHGYSNVADTNKGKTVGRIIRDNLLTFFNILYFVITVLLCVAQSWNNLTFLPVILLNLAIGIYQEIKAKRMIDKLSLVSAPLATVIRDGEKREVPTSEVVIDDIVVFTAGNQIYTDSIVVDGFVDVNEAMITGESDAISKKPGDMLFSGSYIVSGSCHARVEHVGKNNYIEKLASEARKHQKPKSELLRTLTIIIKIVAVIIIPLGLLTFFQNWTINGQSDLTILERYAFSINKTSAVVIGMIPAGLFLLTSIALFVGVRKLGRNKTLVQELYCIEMLARVDVLCLDKTGTITDGTMRVIDCVEVKNSTDYTIREIVGSMMNSFDDINPTSEALIKYFDKNKVLTAVEKLPFSSKRKYSAVTFVDSNSENKVGSFFLGAPEFVLTDQYDKVKSKVERLASEGYRVLVLGHNNGPIKEKKPTKSVKPIALIVLQDHIREEAPDTINYFKENGVEIKVISGDNPMTVAEIARRAGIDNANKFISLEGLSDEEVSAIAFDYTVFGRVSPTQKRVLVQTFKENKKTVAMTGDGVNDILALKEADCSIAMASGSEAVRYVSHLVLTDSNFASMPKVVAEGRRVINNIQRTSSLFLVKTIFTTLLTIMYLILGKVTNNSIVYPFEPSQLILIELLILGLPATILALQPNNEKVEGKFIINVLRRTLPGALTVVLCHGILYYLQPSFGWTQAEYSTFTIILTTAICFYVLFQVTKPFNWWKILMYVSMVALCLIAIFYYGDGLIFGKPLLNLVQFSHRESRILLLLFMVSSYPVMLLIDKLFVRVGLFKK